MAAALESTPKDNEPEIIPVPYFSYGEVFHAVYDFCAAVAAPSSLAEFRSCASLMFKRLPMLDDNVREKKQPPEDAILKKPEPGKPPTKCAWIPVSGDRTAETLWRLSVMYAPGTPTAFYHQIWLGFCDVAKNPATYKPVFYALLLDGFHGYDPDTVRTRWINPENTIKRRLINTRTDSSPITLFHRAFRARRHQAALRVFMDLPKEPFQFDVNAFYFTNPDTNTNTNTNSNGNTNTNTNTNTNSNGDNECRHYALLTLLPEEPKIDELEWFLSQCSADTLNGLNLPYCPLIQVLHRIATWARRGRCDALILSSAGAILRYAHEDGSGVQLLSPNTVARLPSKDEHFYEGTLLSQNEFDVLKARVQRQPSRHEPVAYTLQQLMGKIVHYFTTHKSGVDVCITTARITALVAQLDVAIERQLTYPARLLGRLDATLNSDNNAFPFALLPLVVGYVVFPQT